MHRKRRIPTPTYASSGAVAFFVRLDDLTVEALPLEVFAPLFLLVADSLALLFVFVAPVVVERLRVAGFVGSS